MTEHSEAMRQLYVRYVASHPIDGAIGEVADLLADGTLSRETFDRVVATQELKGSVQLRKGLLDLLLHCIRQALRDHTLTAKERELIRSIATVFGIREGDFYRYRRAEVADLLRQEIIRILDDEVVDPAEAMYQEELQRIFGLGYDQLLELTRDVVDPIVDRTITQAAGHWEVSKDELARIERKLSALRTVYPLSFSQRRALGLPRARRRGGSPPP